MNENVWFNRNKDIQEAPTVLFAVGYIVHFGLPDEMILAIAQVLGFVPEQMLRQQIREKGPMVKPFPFNNHGRYIVSWK